MTAPSRRVRVLWVPYAQRGGVYPVAPAIEQLRRRGADVLLLGLASLKPLADLLGTDFRPNTSAIAYDWSRPEGCDRHGLGPQRAGNGWLAARVAAEYAETAQALAAFRPDVVLVDSLVIGAGLAAQAGGVGWVSYVHYLVDQSAEVDAMHRIWWEGSQPELDAYLAWWDRLRQQLGLGPEPRPRHEAPWYRMSPERTFLLGHPRLRRGQRPLPPYVTRTSFPPWDEPDGASGFSGRVRASGRRQVLVANSSAWQDDLELVVAALGGLADHDVEVVVTVSAEHALEAAAPPNVTVCGYVPHSRLLPTVDVVVATAGYGIVSKALWWGRPLVVASRARDQHYVAEAVAAAGCGLRLAWPPTPRRVGDAVGKVLGSVGIRARARRLSGPMPAYPGPAQVAELLLARGRRR